MVGKIKWTKQDVIERMDAVISSVEGGSTVPVQDLGSKLLAKAKQKAQTMQKPESGGQVTGGMGEM